MDRKYNVGDFIKKAKEIHNNKYDYSKVVYINNKTNICIICPEHGEFWQRPNEHLRGHGCPKCSKNGKLTTDEFIRRAILVHGDRYDYSKTKYINSKTKVCIIDKKLGEFFQFPLSHLKGCVYKNEHRNKKSNITTEDFVKRAKEVHGDKYDYSKVNYINNKTKIKIICKKHGEFTQEANSHIKGAGCPLCSNSHLEDEVKMYLKNNGIKYIEKCGKHNLNWIGNQHLDFYLPDYKTAIECQGEQHFIPVKHFGGEEVFKKRNKRDLNKKILCEKNGIKIIYFSHCKYETFLNEKVIKNVNNIILS